MNLYSQDILAESPNNLGRTKKFILVLLILVQITRAER